MSQSNTCCEELKGLKRVGHMPSSGVGGDGGGGEGEGAA